MFEMTYLSICKGDHRIMNLLKQNKDVKKEVKFIVATFNRLSLLFLVTISLFLGIISGEVFAEVPRSASQITITGNRLMVAIRQEDGILSAAYPYIIKGLTWAAATKAPLDGPHPFIPEEDVHYGFFFN